MPDGDPPADPAYDELRRFPAAAAGPAFRAVLANLGALCNVPPKPYRPREYPLHDAAAGVFVLQFDRAKLRAHLGAPGGTAAGLLNDLADRVRALGFTLVQNTDLKPATARLLLPTADPLAVVLAHGVDSNGAGPDLLGIVRGLRAVHALAPFAVDACGHDTVSGSFLGPVPADTAAEVDALLAALCPADDPGEDEPPDDEDDEDDAADPGDPGRGGFFLWWD